MAEDSPLVSVLVTTYNHKEYIEECLRSIARQKTCYSYEVLVGEDCSPDGTRRVLEQLEHELPDNFHILYRDHNLGAVANGEDLYARARGKYIASCEGDDFWIFDEKLQRQTEFLEKHDDYVAVYSDCLVVGADSKPNGEKYPTCPEEEYPWREYFYSCMPGQTGTWMCRREEYYRARDEFMAMKEYDFYPGDRRNAFLFLCMGKIHVFQEKWSAYRHIVNGGSSYSANLKKDDTFARNEVGFGRTLVKYAEHVGNPTALLIAKKTYYRMWMRWSVGKVHPYHLGSCLRALMREPNWPRLLVSPIQWTVVLGLRVLRGRPVV